MFDQKSVWCLILVIFMLGLALFSSDVYLTVQPQIAISLHTTLQLLHYSFSIFFFGLAFTYLVLCLIGNRLTVYRLAKIGLVIYISGSLLCMSSHALFVFLLGRLLQSVGAATASISIRGLLGIKFRVKEIARILGVCFPLLGFSPAVFPLLGSMITTYLNWRYVFVFLAAGGLLSLVFLKRVINVPQYSSIADEVNAPIQKNKSVFTPVKTISKSPFFWQLSIIYALVFSVYYSYLINVPLVFYRYHLSSHYVTISFWSLSVSYFFANFYVRRLLDKYSLSGLIRFGCSMFILTSFIMLFAVYQFISLLPWTLIVPMCMLCVANAFILPIISAELLEYFSLVRVSMSGLMSVIQFGCVGLTIAFSGVLVRQDPLFLSCYITILAAAAFVLSLRRYSSGSC